jgi:hypothetical protein
VSIAREVADDRETLLRWALKGGLVRGIEIVPIFQNGIRG